MNDFFKMITEVFSFGFYKPNEVERRIKEIREDKRADTEKLASDWKAIGDDFRKVIGTPRKK